MAGSYSATAFAFSGVTFPAMGMVLSAKIWSSILPLTYYIRIFVDQSMKGSPVSVSLPDLCILSLFVFGGFVFSYFRMEKVLNNPTYWGRS
jgi:ABC-2 type transport system permease protein